MSQPVTDISPGSTTRKQYRSQDQDQDLDQPVSIDSSDEPQRMFADKYTESLRPGEYHIAEVTFDDGSKVTMQIPYDEGISDMIRNHFAKKGKTVKDIKIDWSIHGSAYYESKTKKKPKPTNPQLWGRAKSAAKSKFDVYPSAYANAWAAKWYKAHGGGWR